MEPPTGRTGRGVDADLWYAEVNDSAVDEASVRGGSGGSGLIGQEKPAAR